MPRISSFYSDPQVQYLTQLLEEMETDSLVVPRFQRPLVWKEEQRLELLRSIRDEVPIGALLIWRTHRKDLEIYGSWLGPDRSMSDQGNGGTIHYLLDGVQRLSTLFGALRSSRGGAALEDDDKGSDWRREVAFPAYYDLEEEDFLPGPPVPDCPQHLPLSTLLDRVKLLRFQRDLDGPPARVEEWIRRSEELARSFLEYKIAVIPIVTDDLEMATRTFERINSQGTVVGKVHMVHALSWSSDFDLLERLEDLRERYLAPLGWQDVDDDTLLDSCRASQGIALWGRKQDELAGLLKEDPAVLEQAVAALCRAIEFLGDELGVPSPGWLPYRLQAALLARAFCQRPSPNARDRQLLLDWFWMTTYGELFSSLSPNRLGEAIDQMEAAAKGERLVWPGSRPFVRRPLPDQFDARTARARGLALLLADLEPLDPDGIAIDAGETLRTEGNAAILRGLAAVKGIRDIEYSSPGNCFLVPPNARRAFRKGLEEGLLDDRVLESHGISGDAARHLQEGRPIEFLRARRNALDARESERTVEIEAKLMEVR